MRRRRPAIVPSIPAPAVTTTSVACAVAAGVPPARLAALPLLRQLQRLGEEFGEDDLLRLRQLPRQIDYEFDQLHTVSAHAG